MKETDGTKTLRILSWNVNGIRAIYRKGFMDWFSREKPDILCVQETKAREEQVAPDLLRMDGYRSYFVSAERKGYSGVALFTSVEPVRVLTGLGSPVFDAEGRTLIAEYPGFTLFNIYFPNGKASKERLQYRMKFYDFFLDYVEDLRKKDIPVIVCGDVNTAHREIDLARPRENEKVSGFLPEERAWIDKFLEKGYIDTFRQFNPGAGQYTWWDYKTRARERNIGWRIDYFYVSRGLEKRLKSSFILSDVEGSDHCPIGIEVESD